MKLLACCAIAALLASGSAAAMLPTSKSLYDYDVWAATVLKKNGIEDAKVVDAAFPIGFTYCPKGTSALWRYQVISASQLEALNRGEEVPPDGSNFELVESTSAACATARSS